jgi:SAM-dependent methyltransferase
VTTNREETMGSDEIQEIFRRADVYDAVYRGRGKDYAAESALVVEQVRKRNPDASSLLDVACGTGAHLEYFIHAFERVEGVDRSAEMLETAAHKLPDVPLHNGDMRGFDLGRTFDAVTCMFASVGYLETGAELNATLQSFARHLVPGGVIVVEPWWFPDNFLSGYVSGSSVNVGGRTVARVSHSVRAGHASRMEVGYIVADPESGIQQFSDTHVMTLFERERYEAAFTSAGCSVELVPYDQSTPGLFVGVLEEGDHAGA